MITHKSYHIFIIALLFLLSIIDPKIKTLAYGFELSGDLTAKYLRHYINENSILYNENDDTDTSGYLFLNPKLEDRFNNIVSGFFDFELDYYSALDHDENNRAETIEVKVNELYSKINFSDNVFLKAGKQVLKWGTGYAYNPINFINPQKKPIEQETNTIEGINLVDLNIVFSHLSMLDKLLQVLH